MLIRSAHTTCDGIKLLTSADRIEAEVEDSLALRDMKDVHGSVKSFRHSVFPSKQTHQ